MTATTGYVVQKSGFEYNDEYYYRADGGHPVVVYTDQKKAQEKARELSIKFFKACDIGLYLGESIYGKRLEELNAALVASLGEEAKIDCVYEWALPAGISEKKLIEVHDLFAKHARLCFYEVVETEIHK